MLGSIHWAYSKMDCQFHNGAVHWITSTLNHGKGRESFELEPQSRLSPELFKNEKIIALRWPLWLENLCRVVWGANVLASVVSWIMIKVLNVQLWSSATERREVLPWTTSLQTYGILIYRNWGWRRAQWSPKPHWHKLTVDASGEIPQGQAIMSLADPPTWNSEIWIEPPFRVGVHNSRFVLLGSLWGKRTKKEKPTFRCSSFMSRVTLMGRLYSFDTETDLMQRFKRPAWKPLRADGKRNVRKDVKLEA